MQHWRQGAMGKQQIAHSLRAGISQEGRLSQLSMWPVDSSQIHQLRELVPPPPLG